MLLKWSLCLASIALLSSCNIVKLITPTDFNFTVGEEISFQGEVSAGVSQVRVITPDNNSFLTAVNNNTFEFDHTFDEAIEDGELRLEGLVNGSVEAEMAYQIIVIDSGPDLPVDMGTFGFSRPLESEIKSDIDLWATYYYLLVANAISDGEPLRNLNGERLGPEVSTRDWCYGALEGSILVLDGNKATTYNYAGTSTSYQVDCSPYMNHEPSHRVKFRLANNPYGDGVRNYALVPFRTIAVDPSVIPYGTVVYIPEARGVSVKLPNGKSVEHDGYFFAGDTGGLIKQNHIDVFLGAETSNPFSFVKSRESAIFDAQIIDQDSDIAVFLREIH